MLNNNKTMEIIKRIRDRRIELDMSYQDLADKTGMSKSTLQRYETGDIKNIKLDKIEVLAKGLNVTPDYLMGWEEESGEMNEEYKDQKSIVTTMIQTLVDKGMITDANDISDNIMKLIVDMIKVEASEMLKNKN